MITTNSENYLNDLALYNTKIKVNGIIIMDDINWKCVNDAMLDFLKTIDNIIIALNTFSILKFKKDIKSKIFKLIIIFIDKQSIVDKFIFLKRILKL